MRKGFQSFKMAAVAMCCISSSVFAGVTITGTRIVFPANQQATTVQLSNSAEQPAMIQAWLDNGDPNQIPEAGQIPFILTPALTRIEAKKGQMIRLIAKDTESLPQDRESLYWFNILDIPATAQIGGEGSANQLKVSIRSRIKVFYRPEKLNMSPQKAFAAVKVNYDAASKTVSVNNPSPYYISFQTMKLNKGKETVSYDETLMVAPFATESFKPKMNFHPTQATYSLINDYGGDQHFTANLVTGTSTPVETEKKLAAVEAKTEAVETAVAAPAAMEEGE
jgi:fimbrial chaperone protein/chaperone protein EcpD